MVISHSYPLSGSSESAQWIYKVTNGQIVLASIGLNGFFVISGFFIFQSLQRSTNLKIYFKKRFLRLFPGLFVVLLLSVLLVPFIYEQSIPLFSNAEFYTYIPNNMSLYNFQSSIKGIFDHNPYHSINGSLWTLRYEFSLYVLLAILFFFRKNKLIVKMMLFMSFIILFFTYTLFLDRFSGAFVFGMQGYHILNFSAFFISGSLLASLGFDKVISKGTLFFTSSIFISCLVVFVLIYFNYYNNFKHIIFPIVILLIGYMPIPVLKNFQKIGDLSYGIYIYSFPIQQTLMYFFNFDLYELIIYSILVSVTFGYLSWHLIEKKALEYKNKKILNLKFLNIKVD
ncbi:acyltransferase [Flavivirga jejuensis]